MFTIKCTICSNKIQPSDMVMKQQPYIFHLSCFTCCVCCEPLQKGEQFVLRNNQLYCRHDFEKENYLARQCEEELILEGMIHHHHHHRSRDGRRGPKRPRTILTSAQRKQFKATFEVSPKPCRKVREALAKDTGLSVRVVQVWFQNQRAKMKKIQRKAKDGGKHTDSDKDKDDKSIKQESPSSDYLGLDNSFSSQPLNPNLPYSPDDFPTNSNDSYCTSGSLSLDDYDDQSDTMSIKNSDLHTPSGHSSHDNLNYNSLNPIDKLYSMQDSYFQ